VTTARGNRELDDAAAGERASNQYRATRRTAPVGGSNRFLSVEELAAYLGVPKKTAYVCWRQWGLRGYRVGGTCGSASGTWRNGSRPGRYDRGQNLQALLLPRRPAGRLPAPVGGPLPHHWRPVQPPSTSSPSAPTCARLRASRSRSSTTSAPAPSSTQGRAGAVPRGRRDLAGPAPGRGLQHRDLQVGAGTSGGPAVYLS
jgi:excisionase family DNA binding protein